MDDLRHRHIALRLGAAELLRTGQAGGRLLLDPGMSGVVPFSFARADSTTCATYIDRGGIIRLVPANRLRLHWLDLNADGIAETPVILLEDTDTNLLLRSEEFDNAAWAKTRTTVTANADTGPRVAGTADKLKEDASVTTTHFMAQAITITAGEDVAGFCLVKAGERTRFLFRICDGGTTTGFQCDINLSTRTIVSSGGFGTGVLKLGPVVFLLAGGYMLVGMVGTIDPATTTSANMFFYMCDNTGNPVYTGDGASGFFIGGTQLQRAKVFGSYIPTSAATVTRAADDFKLLTPLGLPEPFTAYWKFIELGTLRTGAADGNRVLYLGTANPAFWIQARNNNSYELDHHNGVVQVSSAIAAGSVPAVLDIVELVAQVAADGTPTLYQAKNGGAWVQGSAGSAAAFAASLGLPATLQVGQQGGASRARMGLMNVLWARSVIVPPDLMRQAAAA